MLFTLSCSPQDVYAATPLIAASGKNHIEVARFLVEHGASTDYQKKVFYDHFGFLLYHILVFLHRMESQPFKLHVSMAIQIL